MDKPTEAAQRKSRQKSPEQPKKHERMQSAHSNVQSRYRNIPLAVKPSEEVKKEAAKKRPMTASVVPVQKKEANVEKVKVGNEGKKPMEKKLVPKKEEEKKVAAPVKKELEQKKPVTAKAKDIKQPN